MPRHLLQPACVSEIACRYELNRDLCRGDASRPLPNLRNLLQRNVAGDRALPACYAARLTRALDRDVEVLRDAPDARARQLATGQFLYPTLPQHRNAAVCWRAMTASGNFRPGVCRLLGRPERRRPCCRQHHSFRAKTSNFAPYRANASLRPSNWPEPISSLISCSARSTAFRK